MAIAKARGGETMTESKKKRTVVAAAAVSPARRSNEKKRKKEHSEEARAGVEGGVSEREMEGVAGREKESTRRGQKKAAKVMKPTRAEERLRKHDGSGGSDSGGEDSGDYGLRNASNGASMALEALEMHGRNFLRMFDDYDSEDELANAKQSSGEVACEHGRSFGGAAGTASDGNGDGDWNAAADGGTAAAAAAAEAEAAAAAAEADAAAPRGIAEIRGLMRGEDGAIATPSPRTKKKVLALDPTTPTSVRGSMKKERRLFLSGRIGDIHPTLASKSSPFSARKSLDLEALARVGGEAAGGMGGGGNDDDDDANDMLSAAVFEALKREAEALGTLGLDTKQRKKAEAEQLARLGATPQRKQRMPLTIGVGMKRNDATRQARQLAIDIAEGMTNSSSKKRKRGSSSGDIAGASSSAKTRRSQEERGLKTSEGVFRGGVLFVSPMKKQRTPSTSGRSKGISDFGFGGAKGKRPSGKKGKGKGKGGKKGKKKRH